MKTYRITQRSTAAFSLVEVTLALGVAAFCLIAILGLLPAGLNTNQTSTKQTTANGILSAIVADLRATPATSTNSPLFGIDFQHQHWKTLYFAADGRVVPKGDPNAIFFATVTFAGSGGGSGSQGDNDNDEGNGQNNNGGNVTATFADVKVGWPAAAGGKSGTGDSDTGDSDAGGGKSGNSATAGSIVETFVGLDRNGVSNGSNGGGESDN